MTAAVSGVGSRFYVGGLLASDTFSAVPEVLKLSGVELTAELLDVTSLDSTSGYREHITGIRDGGKVSFDFNWTKATSQTTLRDRLSGGTYYYSIYYNGGTTVTFRGIVESFKLNVEPSAAITASVSIRINGAPTWTTINEILIVGDSYGKRGGSYPYYEQYMSFSGTIENDAFAGSNLWYTGEGAVFHIPTALTAGIAAHPTTDVVVINGGINDILGLTDSPTTAVTTADLKVQMAALIQEVWDAGMEPMVINLPPVANWSGWDAGSMASIVDAYNTWLEAYCTYAGIRHIDIYSALTDGTGGAGGGALQSAYDIGEGLHVSVAGAQVIAGLVDAAIVAGPVVPTFAQTIVRARPKPGLLSVTDMENITAVATALEDEWDTAYDIWLLNQEDVTAGGNAVTGLVNDTVCTITGTISHDSNGMVLEAGEYLNTGFAPNPDFTDYDISVGMVITACDNPTTSAYPWGCYTGLNDGLLLWTDGATGFKFYPYYFGPAGGTYVRTLANVIDTCVECRSVVTSGTTMQGTIYESGSQVHTGSYTRNNKPTDDFLIGAAKIFGGSINSATDSTFAAFYITDATNTQSLWASTFEGIA